MKNLTRLETFLPDVQGAEEFCRFFGEWCRSRSNLLDFIQTQALLDRRVNQLDIVTNVCLAFEVEDNKYNNSN